MFGEVYNLLGSWTFRVCHCQCENDIYIWKRLYVSCTFCQYVLYINLLQLVHYILEVPFIYILKVHRSVNVQVKYCIACL